MSYYEKRIAELEARVAELSHQQRLKAIPIEAQLLERYALMQAEVANLKSETGRFKAEVERLDETNNRLYNELNRYALDDLHWQQKVERLRKAGDILAFHYISLGRKIFQDDALPPSVNAWNAAKDGKPTE